MPLTDPLKQAAVDPSNQTVDAVTAWPADVPERAATLVAAQNAQQMIGAAVVPPPVPAVTPDALLLYDVPLNKGSSGCIGSTTSDFLYIPYMPWAAKGGTWTDAAGAPQGNAPFASTAIALGFAGTVLLDVTALAKPGQDPQICLRQRASGGTAPAFLFNSRESGAGPTITYDGLPPLQAIADLEINTSTSAELGGRTTTTVGVTSMLYLRFPPPPAGTAKATLTLSLIHVYNAGGFLEAYDGAMRLAAPPSDTYTLKGDPRVFFETQCFEDAPGYMKAILFGDPAHSFQIDKYHQRNIVVDETGSKVLQITFDPAVNFGASTSILFPNQDEATEAACEFDIRFMPDMEFGMQQGFKAAFGWSSATKPDDAYFAGIWGLKPGRCGTLLAGNGGAMSHGNDGWSMRWDCFCPITPASHPMYRHVVPVQYVYHPGQADFYGDPWPWSAAQTTPKLGEWHTITQRAKVNSLVDGGGFNKDAELDGYLDHALAIRKRDFALRTTDKPIIATTPTVPNSSILVDSQLRIGRVWFNVYHGGTAFPLQRCSFQVRNFRAAVLTP